MDFSKFTFIESYKNNINLYFDFDIRILTNHNRNTFDDYKSLIYFLENNAGKELYITNSQIEDFFVDGDKLVLNLFKYQEFCKNIGQNGKNRAQAFFSRGIRNYTEEEVKNIKLSASENDILEIIKKFSKEQKQDFIDKLKLIEDINFPQNIDIENFSEEDFSKAFLELAKKPNKQNLIISNYPKIQIEILEQHKKFLEDNLDKNETFIQNCIDGKIDNEGNNIIKTDEEIKIIRKSRCLIFGLEFISHKSQGELSRKRFDILTKLSEDKNEHVIIELKSPCEDVFKIVDVENINGGKSTEYHLSKDIARSIPQISHYKNQIENKFETDDDFQRIGIKKGKVAKSIIIIGTRKYDDVIWEENYISLQRSFSNGLEILTYTDLIKKLETTIKNLKDNLI